MALRHIPANALALSRVRLAWDVPRTDRDMQEAAVQAVRVRQPLHAPISRHLTVTTLSFVTTESDPALVKMRVVIRTRPSPTWSNATLMRWIAVRVSNVQRFVPTKNESCGAISIIPEDGCVIVSGPFRSQPPITVMTTTSKA